VIPSGNTAYFSSTGGVNQIFNGNISGAGTLTQSASGSTPALYLGGDNSGFTGTFNGSSSGTSRIRFTSPNAGSASADWFFNNASTTINNSAATFVMTGTTNTIKFGSLQGRGTFRSDQAAGTHVVMEVGGKNTNFAWAGIISNSAQAISLRKVGTGTMTVTGINTYSDGTTIAQGAITLGANNCLGSGTITINAGAVLNKNGFTLTNTIVNNGGTINP
jgi:autotransporter-associated beta strand protein